jgi:predicted nucleotidyltransferase
VSPNLEKLLPTLVGAGVEFIIIGGVAGILHGSARATYDVDLVYSRDEQNIQQLASVLAAHNPYLRNAPEGLPFVWDSKTIRHGLNFTLTTTIGDIDVAIDIEAFDVCFKCIDLPTLIRIKEAAGRPKDREAIAELRVLLEETGQRPF